MWTRTLVIGAVLNLALCGTAIGGPTDFGGRPVKSAPASGQIAQLTPPPAGPAPGELTGLMAVNALIGNTLAISEPDTERDSISFLADGTVASAKERKGAIWYVTGTKLCIREGEQTPGPRDCASISVTGQSVVITRPDGRLMRGQIVKADSETLTGLLAMNALIGNTLVINESSADRQAAIHFLPDGTVRGMSGQRARTGTWYMTGGRLCIRDSDKDLRQLDCVTIKVTGDSVAIEVSRDRAMTGQILKGNPRNL
jgi:hypothetical protein